jgi:hypothetical protein
MSRKSKACMRQRWADHVCAGRLACDTQSNPYMYAQPVIMLAVLCPLLCPSVLPCCAPLPLPSPQAKGHPMTLFAGLTALTRLTSCELLLFGDGRVFEHLGR